MSDKMINSTKPVKGEGVLTDTLQDMQEFDMNKLNDPITKSGSKGK
jgi:hypothetical protein